MLRVNMGLRDRAILAIAELAWIVEAEELTDSDVLDVIDNQTTGECPDGCQSETCCDYQLLSGMVWGILR